MRTTRMPLFARMSALTQTVYINREQLQNLALRAALFLALGIAGDMVLTGGWSVMKFFITQAWPIYQETMSF
jgi:hypothetical protein